MRVLILDHYYDSFVAEHYASHPRLASAPFDEQSRSLSAELFGETQFQVDALNALGHEALYMPVNVPQLALAWAREHSLRLPRRWAIQIARHGWIPWVSRSERFAWQSALLSHIADDLEAALVHVQCMGLMRTETLSALRRPGRIISAQSATPSVPWGHLREYDVFFSSLPHYVERAMETGTVAHYLPLAFDPRVAAQGWADRDVDVSFVGGLSDLHIARITLLEAAAREIAIEVWTPDAPTSWNPIPPRMTLHGSAWGRGMYNVLGQSRLTINIHGEIARGYANNLRLFEATGMGAMLVTDGSRNIRDLFEPGEEVVVFESVEELVELLAYYSSHPDEAADIARRGQARTLRDHTWDRRMQQFVTLLDAA